MLTDWHQLGYFLVVKSSFLPVHSCFKESKLINRKAFFSFFFFWHAQNKDLNYLEGNFRAINIVRNKRLLLLCVCVFFYIVDIIAGSKLPDEGQIFQKDLPLWNHKQPSFNVVGVKESLQKTDEKNSKSSVQGAEIAPSHFPFNSPCPNSILFALNSHSAALASAEKR